MASTEQWPGQGTDTTALDEQFENLRNTFYSRLCSERGRLLTLSAALMQEGDPRPVLDDIRNLAHRMCGAAAIFEAAEVGTAATTLEQTAHRAAAAFDNNRQVSQALEALVDVLASANSRRQPPRPQCK